MLKIIKIEKNPRNKHKKAYRVVTRDKEGNIIDIHERKAHGRYPNYFSVRNMKKRGMRYHTAASVKREKVTEGWENPKRKRKPKKKIAVKRKRKVICAKKNPPEFKKGDLVKISAPGLPGHGKTGRILSSHGDHFQIESGPTEHKNYMHPANRLTLAKRNPRKRKITRAKRNPPARKRHETIIVGYSTYPGPNYDKPKRWFYDGIGFTRKKENAMKFSGDGARAEAKRIQYQLPREIYAIRVETV